ncbi:helix-turn-helix transcriptional regulator [Labrys wisconsinensis]|uniref:DNA-binding CsgD family transcriptional regulator n=1 Tax=Labrys wisconsinensis TaxID=425677 RepID=A0ABU0JLC6_9HYPH|nr:helix-turn-helix transcriptional regulator [Labrys wisconsinensis]MDQ0473942.1 DNA-binding CsgD family transcriptional regulator [Labrys wisconsinensis]
METYQYINPLWKFWQTAVPGQVIRLDDGLIDDECRRSTFYARYGDYLDKGDGVCMLLSIRTAKVLVHASQPRRPGEGQINADLLENLREDLLLSFEIAGTFTHASNMTGNIIRSLDQKGIGAALLSEDDRIEKSNSSMNDLLRAGSVLRLDGGRLVSGSAIQSSEFSDLVRRTRRNGVPGRLSYCDPAGRRRGSVVAYPAPTSFDWEGVHQSKIVLLVTDSSRPKELLADNLGKNYGLTRAETRVASLLLDGKTSRQIATELKVQANSVRAHLKATYAKTGTHSQVELLNLLQVESEQAL